MRVKPVEAYRERKGMDLANTYQKKRVEILWLAKEGPSKPKPRDSGNDRDDTDGIPPDVDRHRYKGHFLHALC